MSANELKLQVFVHIGVPKAASKTLQHSFFEKHPQIEHIWEHGDDLQQRGFLRSIWMDDSARFDLEDMRRVASELIARVSNTSTVAVISDEALTNMWGVDRATKAHRLRAIVGHASIVLVIREQRDALESLYLHERSSLVQAGERVPSFDTWISTDLERARARKLPTFDYAEIVEIYSDLFDDRLHLFMIEQLREDSERFSRQLCALMDIDHHAAIGLLSNVRNQRETKRAAAFTNIRRHVPLSASWVPPFVRISVGRFLQGGERLSLNLPATIEAELMARFRRGNQEVASRFGLPLEKYGYPT